VSDERRTTRGLCADHVDADSEELYQEQKEKFGNPDGTFRDLAYEDLKDLPLLDSCIRETLRIVSSERSRGTSTVRY
jgi:hypothetical protein